MADKYLIILVLAAVLLGGLRLKLRRQSLLANIKACPFNCQAINLQGPNDYTRTAYDRRRLADQVLAKKPHRSYRRSHRSSAQCIDRMQAERVLAAGQFSVTSGERPAAVYGAQRELRGPLSPGAISGTRL